MLLFIIYNQSFIKIDYKQICKLKTFILDKISKYIINENSFIKYKIFIHNISIIL